MLLITIIKGAATLVLTEMSLCHDKQAGSYAKKKNNNNILLL